MSSDEFRCDCGGGFPGDVPDDEVCQCGSAFARPKARTGLQRKTPLKSGSGLKRGRPLKQTGGLKRTGPIARSAPATPKKKAPARPRPGTDDIPEAVRAVVLARCGGACEACGGTLEGTVPHLHHRKKRTRLNHTPDNLVALHPLCHVNAPLAVHQRPTWAQERGLIVMAGEDSLTKPLLLPTGKLVLLDPVEPVYLPAPVLRAA